MNYKKKILTIAFAIMMLAGGFAIDSQAQTGNRIVVQRVYRRPVVVRPYAYSNPYWRARYYGYPYYGYSGFYDPFYDSFYYQSPYQRYLEQRFYLQRELNGNRRELAKHELKYRADGVITAKEQRELEDDRRDVQRSIEKLRRFGRDY